MYLDPLRIRCPELPICVPPLVLGRSVAEIQRLEQAVGLSLPGAYIEFLPWMGQSSPFLGGTHWEYNNLVALQTAAPALLQAHTFPLPLPHRAFVFALHQGYAFVTVQGEGSKRGAGLLAQ